MIKKLSITFVALVAIQILFQSNAFAADFNAGRIIDDSVFADKTTMTVGQIQDFLNSKVTSCDTNGQQNSEFGGPDLNGDGRVQRWEWGKANYNQTTFPCLRDYTVSDGRSAAQVIYDTAQKYTINPQVFIVLLQKEQGLVTDTWPLNVQYRSATGYGCPDTAPCDSQYYGLINQLDWSGKMFRAILNNSPTWYTPYELGDNYIQYNPVSSCGGSVVNVQTRATQALYNYTPYQPNQATLDAGWGTAPCGAYGNLRFHQYFTGWFGDTYTKFISLDTPRWMVVNKDTYKRDPFTNNGIDFVASGTQLRFVDKIYVAGNWYLRTEADSNAHNIKGMLMYDLSEISPESFSTPRYMKLTSDRKKWNPATGTVDNSVTYEAGTDIFFTDKLFINGQYFYRSKTDSTKGVSLYITASAVRDIAYTPFDTPRYMQILSNTTKVDPVTEISDSTPTPASQYLFNSKISINGIWYFRTSADTSRNATLAIPATLISEIPYTAYSTPAKWMLVSTTTSRYEPSSGLPVSNSTIEGGTQVKISQTITVNGNTYYRTLWNQNHGDNVAIPANVIQELPFVNLDNPRTLYLREDATKVNPLTGVAVDGILPKGYALPYKTKVLVEGVWYLRTESDTTNNLYKAIPLYKLSDTL
jgi:hypothetical protein